MRENEPGEVTVQGDPHRRSSRFVDRLDVHLLDQASDAADQVSVRVVGAVGRLGQARLELLDLAGVVLGRARVQLHGRRAFSVELFKGRLELGLFDFEGFELLADDGGRRRAGEQGVSPALDGAFDLGDPTRQRSTAILDLGSLFSPGGVVGPDVGRDGVGSDQSRAQAVQHALLDLSPVDVAVVVAGGRPLLAIGRADQPPLAERGIGGPAAPALRQA
nr:hypothetical protein [Brevundimonas sp.]